MGHDMREEKKSKNPKNNAKNQSDMPLALSWDTLPYLAKADMTLAEPERQRVAKGIFDAIKAVCKEIFTDGQRALNPAMKMEGEASKNHSYSQDALEQARANRAEAESYRTKIMAEVNQGAQEFIDLAKSTIEKECLTLREQAAQEATGFWDR